jgi:hypothetical protein
VNFSSQYKLLINPKLLEKLSNIVENKRPEIVELSLNFIGNFIIDSNEIKNEILNSNLFKGIVKLIEKENNSKEISQQLAFVLSNVVNLNKVQLSEQLVFYNKIS